MKVHCHHLGILSALAALGAGACVGPPDAASGDMGNVTASLQLSPTTTLTTASYSITGPNAFARSGTVDVSNSQTISVLYRRKDGNYGLIETGREPNRPGARS